MKILVDLKDIQSISDLLEDRKDVYQSNDDAFEIARKILKEYPFDKDYIKQVEKDIVVNNLDLTRIREIIFLAGVTGDTSRLREAEWILWSIQNQRKDKPKPIEHKPDARCDGCEYQHPYAKNLSYDVVAEKVFCNRGIQAPYYKDGRTIISFPPNLMICSVYKWNNGLEKIKETKKLNATTEFVKVLADDVRENKQHILGILNIMLDSNCTRGWDRDTIFKGKLKELKAKLVGDK